MIGPLVLFENVNVTHLTISSILSSGNPADEVLLKEAWRGYE